MTITGIEYGKQMLTAFSITSYDGVTPPTFKLAHNSILFAPASIAAYISSTLSVQNYLINVIVIYLFLKKNNVLLVFFEIRVTLI